MLRSAPDHSAARDYCWHDAACSQGRRCFRWSCATRALTVPMGRHDARGDVARTFTCWCAVNLPPRLSSRCHSTARQTVAHAAPSLATNDTLRGLKVEGQPPYAGPGVDAHAARAVGRAAVPQIVCGWRNPAAMVLPAQAPLHPAVLWGAPPRSAATCWSKSALLSAGCSHCVTGNRWRSTWALRARACP